VRKFLSIFGGSARRKASPVPGFGNIDLRTLAGSMVRDEAGKLNGQTPKRPIRPAPVPEGAAPRAPQAAPRWREEHMQEPPPMPRRTIPAEAREARAPDMRVPDPRAPGGAPAAPGRAPTGRGQAPQGRDDGFARQAPREGYLATFGLEKSFGNRKVVRGPSIYVRRGEAVGLLGPNGAGKTTVFYMITGLIKPDRGRIELDGHDVTRLPMYQRARLGIGYLPQEASIFRGLNVEENIRAVLEVTEPNRRKREADLNSLLAEFGLTKLRKSPSIALSGGERRRCEIARALATRPNYMLLDEPFAGIDPIAVGDIKTLVRHLTSRGIGVLITDHNVRETLALTDRAYIIYSGEVLREGRAADIVNDPEVRRLYLGEEFRM
jgi:lipopolysaccharide export system ATP-binding protein